MVRGRAGERGEALTALSPVTPVTRRTRREKSSQRGWQTTESDGLPYRAAEPQPKRESSRAGRGVGRPQKTMVCPTGRGLRRTESAVVLWLLLPLQEGVEGLAVYAGLARGGADVAIAPGQQG